MGCRILEDKEDGMCALYCSTKGIAFGPTIVNREAAEKFIGEYLSQDARTYSETELMNCFTDFTTNFVCECGAVRQDECAYCADDVTLTVEAGMTLTVEAGKRVHTWPLCKHCGKAKDDHYYRENQCDCGSPHYEGTYYEAGAHTASEDCTRDAEPKDGERFECSHCQEKRAKEERIKENRRQQIEASKQPRPAQDKTA